MSLKFTSDLSALMLTAVKNAADDGFIYIFSGPEPGGAGDALDMVTLHTQLAMLSVGGDNVTGLTFEAAVGALLAKTGAEAWSGLVAFDGAEDAETTLTPTFFRFCPAGDNGRGAASTPRMQADVGGPSSSAFLKLGTDTLTDNATNTTGATGFNVRLFSLG